MPTDPLDSATVVVLRDAGEGCEVLLMQRHAESRAFGGAHVFPGGCVDASDTTAALVAATKSPGAPPLADTVCRVAAIRELFEESGLLLARVDGAAIDFADDRVRTRFAAHRAALVAGRCSFAEVVASERLDLAGDALHYFSRWITPVTAPRRYDARFYATTLPPGQEPFHDDRETIATAWLTPRAALAEARAGRMTLAPPTVRTLEDLSALGTVERVVEYARRARVVPILPKPVAIDGRMAILYPGDVDYERATAGASLPETAAGPQNRVLMTGGAWQSIRTSS